MKKVILTLICLMVVNGCAQQQARDNLAKLQVGMSEQEARELMGKPFESEANNKVKILYYETRVQGTFDTVNSCLTPLAFENGVLVGWGWRFIDKDIDKHEIRIR